MARKTEEKSTPAASRSTQPDFHAGLAIADSLAKQFAENFPSKREEQTWRDYFRNFCVPGLRWLWKNGDASTRTTIAARIAVWREQATADIQSLQERIRTRELLREGGAL